MSQDVRFHCYPAVDPKTFCFISANLYGKKCQGCGYEWGSVSHITITFEDLRKNGVEKPFINRLLDCGHPLVEAKKEMAKIKVTEFHNQPMLTCGRCDGAKAEEGEGETNV